MRDLPGLFCKCHSREVRGKRGPSDSVHQGARRRFDAHAAMLVHYNGTEQTFLRLRRSACFCRFPSYVIELNLEDGSNLRLDLVVEKKTVQRKRALAAKLRFLRVSDDERYLYAWSLAATPRERWRSGANLLRAARSSRPSPNRKSASK